MVCLLTKVIRVKLERDNLSPIKIVPAASPLNIIVDIVINNLSRWRTGESVLRTKYDGARRIGDQTPVDGDADSGVGSGLSMNLV
jgi:hypothetical protein